GGLVFLDHGQGVTSLMMHMSRVDVTAGARVEQGDVIGAVGGTGRATGPHLHWGVYWRGAWLDPQLLVGPMEDAIAAADGN
ncbi:M23 family metallopeptidase, partial [Parvibaculum sp.]|uniref:M23 family metallopeptidase n=1 Tax=Parvibaculum sp. TaxID=2024848 RepID=UPI0032EC425A